MRKIIQFSALFALLVAAIPSHAAIVFVSSIAPWGAANNTGESGSFTPGSGDQVFAVGEDASDNGYTLSFAGTGTYSVINPPGQISETNFTSSWVLVWNSSATASSQTVTVSSSDSTPYLAGAGIIYSGVGSVSASYTTPRAPGAGTNAILGNSVTVPTGDVLIAVAVDLLSSSYAITCSGTSRASGTGGTSYPTPQYFEWCEWDGSGAAIQPAFTSTGGGAVDYFIVIQILMTPSGGSSCTNDGYTSAGALAVPNGSSGSYVGNSGSFVTPNCSSTEYWQPTVGNFGAN